MANIIRTVKYGGYSLMSDFHLRDKRLSWRAKGLLSFMLCLSGEYKIEELFQFASDGKIIDDIEEGLAELEKYGYLTMSTCGNKVEYNVYERPYTKETLQTPISEIPYAEDVPGKPESAKYSEEEEIERLRERLNLKAVAEKCSDRFVEMVFREVCRRDAEFRKLMTAKAFELVCVIASERLRYESNCDFYRFSAVVNGYLDNVVSGIRSASGGNEPIITNRQEERERLVNK